MSPRRRPDREYDGALEAMTAEELRGFVRDLLERLDDDQGGVLADSLIARAAKGTAGWKPAGPGRGLAGEVERYVEAARRVGHGDPAEVDEYLRRGSRSFLADEPSTARAVFDALLPPIADGEIHLGQHEMVDEVLQVSLGDCAARYVASVYLTTAPKDRARAVHQAIDAVQGLSSIWEPVGQMERVATGPLPELDAFLPRWVRYLERRPTPAEAWESGRDHWLREAVRRLEGIAGLERIARKTRKPETVRAWCDAVVEERDWGEALRAYDAATRLVRGSDWRGMFLDGAALAARELGRPDARRLHAAWLGAPSLVRLLRWLGAGSPPATALVKRARQAIRRCPKKAGRQLGLLYILTGNVVAAAELLEAAPGLGWSSEDHPGHVVFPAFAALLAGRARAKLGPQFFARLQEAPRDPFDTAIGEDGDVERPTLSTPSVGDLIATAGSGAGIDAKSRDAMLQAMRRATTKRVEGIVGNKRRDHYWHAATLLACCLEAARAIGDEREVREWVDAVRQGYSRHYAFQEEYRRALASMAS